MNDRYVVPDKEQCRYEYYVLDTETNKAVFTSTNKATVLECCDTLNNQLVEDKD